MQQEKDEKEKREQVHYTFTPVLTKGKIKTKQEPKRNVT